MLENDGEREVAHSAFFFLLTSVLLLPSIIAYFSCRLRHRPPTFIKLFTILFIWMAGIGVIMGISNLRATIVMFLRILIAFEALCMMYAYSYVYGEDKKIYWMAILMQAIFLFQYAQIYSIANLAGEAHLITSYYALFLLPLVLMHPSKIIRVVSILIVTFAVFASFKRGGLIALALGLIVYIICSNNIQSKGLKTFTYVLFALCTIGIVFYYLSMSDFGGVIERIASIGDDGGSGRTDVWSKTWEMILQSNFFRFLIGHGNNAVLLDSPLKLSAHNDLLEAWYDYGLLGCLLYISVLVSLIRYAIRQLKKRSAIAPSMMMMVTIMGTLTMISHVLIYFFLTLCCLTFGLLAGQERFYEQHK